jgi:hypothetical protein
MLLATIPQKRVLCLIDSKSLSTFVTILKILNTLFQRIPSIAHSPMPNSITDRVKTLDMID